MTLVGGGARIPPFCDASDCLAIVWEFIDGRATRYVELASRRRPAGLAPVAHAPSHSPDDARPYGADDPLKEPPRSQPAKEASSWLLARPARRSILPTRPAAVSKPRVSPPLTRVRRFPFQMRFSSQRRAGRNFRLPWSRGPGPRQLASICLVQRPSLKAGAAEPAHLAAGATTRPKRKCSACADEERALFTSSIARRAWKVGHSSPPNAS